jgi:hypothetical protein
MLISRRQILCLAAVLFFGLCALPAYSAAPTQVASAGKAAAKTTMLASDAGKSLLEQYRSVTRQTEILRIYNQHLKELLNSQAQEKASLEKQLKDIEVTRQEMLPMILKMLDSLDKFVAMDLPFLPEERKQRLTGLKEMMAKANITDAEKFRRIMEAFQIENEYGKTIEAYKGNIVLNGKTSAVNFLRLGRVALYYQRLDGSETGYWNKEEKCWETLSSDYSNAIRNGLRIARKETAPDMLIVPVPAPEAAK